MAKAVIYRRNAHFVLDDLFNNFIHLSLNDAFYLGRLMQGAECNAFLHSRIVFYKTTHGTLLITFGAYETFREYTILAVLEYFTPIDKWRVTIY